MLRDDAVPTGTIAVRLNAEETSTLLDIIALAAARAEVGRTDDALCLRAIVRKLAGLGDVDELTVHSAGRRHR
ncbi:hypothetical protein [Nonomuraea endophytica]|uniref:hypothetical protein n=1 Tax=Nonomuraea endophytica TaxID=714136 RepID=UPI0037C90AAA